MKTHRTVQPIHFDLITRAIKKFNKSSSKLSKQMIELSKTMIILAFAMFILTIITLAFNIANVIVSNDELINALRFSP